MKGFIEAVKYELTPMFAGYSIEEVEVVKMNDRKLHGLAFKRDGVDYAPTVCLDDAYESFMNDEVKFNQIVNDVHRMILRAEFTDNIDTTEILGNVEDKLSLRMIDMRKNEEFLKTVPFKRVENGVTLALVADVVNGEGRAVVTDDMLEYLKISDKAVMDTAISNCRDDAVLRDVADAMFGTGKNFLLEDKAEGFMFVLTNKSGIFGAVSMAFLETRKRVAELLGEFYALPSSVHEWIILPKSRGLDIDELKAMVASANCTVVDDEDVLSDGVYFVDKDGRLEEAA